MMIHNLDKPKVSRRMFLKTSATTAVAAAIGSQLLGQSGNKLFTSAKSDKAVENDIWLAGVCSMCKLGDCVNRWHVVNGVVVEIEGHPDSPINKGRICARGLSAGVTLYNPYRVKAPMKRTNPEKGLNIDPKWVEISWDEAYSIVAEQLKKAREYDPRSLMLNSGFGVNETVFRSLFMSAYGSPNSISSNGPLCAVHYATNLVQANHPISACDMGYTNYMITIGRSVGPNHGVANGGTSNLLDAIKRGMKFISVDPRASTETSLGEWVPIRPGTDLAFTLGITNVMMYEIQIYDLEFLKFRSNAPYLIGSDGDYIRDEASNKPLIWDLSDSLAKTFDDPKLVDPALDGYYNVAGAEVAPGFQKVRDRIKEYTPEWAEGISTVPASTIRRLAQEFVEAAQIGSTIEIDGFTFPFRPVSIIAERGSIGHMNGTQLDLTTKWINMMVGNLEVPGGVIGIGKKGPILAPDEDGVVKPSNEAAGVDFAFPPNRVDMAEFYPNRHTTVHMAYKAIDDPKTYHLPYDVQVVWGYGGNSIRGTASPEIIESALKKVPFVFVIGYHYDAMAEMSDVILPENSMLERLFIKSNGTDQQTDADIQSRVGEVGRDPIPVVYNTKDGDEMLIELAERIGILYGEKGMNAAFNKSQKEGYFVDTEKRYSLEEYLDFKVRSMEDGKFGLKDLQKEGFLIRNVSKKLGYNYYYLPDRQTRHPFYFQRLKFTRDKLLGEIESAGVTIPKLDMEKWKEHYDPIPHWMPPIDYDAPAEYDLTVTNWKVPFMMFGLGACEENPWFDEIIDLTNPYVRTILINAATAEKKQIKDGDEIWVESRYGKVQGKVKTTQLVHPDVVGIAGNYGSGTMHMNPIARKGPHYNLLLSSDENTMDPISGGLDISPRVKVYKA